MDFAASGLIMALLLLAVTVTGGTVLTLVSATSINMIAPTVNNFSFVKRQQQNSHLSIYLLPPPPPTTTPLQCRFNSAIKRGVYAP